ncbi:MAG: ribosome-associated translation inhibitor RaiA [Candidatus Marinimicrobia bacterium]|nr:ribosome-associated translation inhibitor RaiA [Candidatus Neomarinimicrobiota bacterium]
MKVLITARHFTISEETRKYADNEVQRLEKIFDRLVSVHVILEKIKDYIYQTELVVKVPLKVLTIHERDEELTKSIDLAVDKMIRQLKKYKDQLRTRP